jgi:hypothetical protein
MLVLVLLCTIYTTCFIEGKEGEEKKEKCRGKRTRGREENF